jgi:very-short-patch-repair endonuclease
MSVCGCEQCGKSLEQLRVERGETSDTERPRITELGRIRAKLMSPIEEAFLRAWIGNQEPVVERERLRVGPWWIEPQAYVGPFRVDFVCGVDFGHRSADLVVELDGHEFHNKTAEQVEADRKRDRAFVRLGAVALRFTGREVTRIATSCVAEVQAQLKTWAERSMRSRA